MPKMLLPDVNVWLAFVFDGHVHHQPARQWFESLSDEVCFFSRMTQQGFLRLASNPSVFKNNSLTLTEAWQKYDILLSDPRVSYIVEPVGIERHWRSFTVRESFSPKVWNDAYLAAFTLSANLELVTFDKGLAQYKPANCTVLQ